MTDTPEDIVRALASTDPPVSSDGECMMCRFILMYHRDTSRHGVGCEWRRAVEWVEANPK
jgi:hypothetical protein